MQSIFLLATLDTKGPEAAFLRDRLVELGIEVKVVDAGCQGAPAFAADVTREAVFEAGGTTLAQMLAQADRGLAVTTAAAGAAKLIWEAHVRGEVSGVLAIGGSAGTTIGTAAMRSLPIGVPKLMVSTLASGQVRHWVGDKDILMLNSIVDIAGINRISRQVLNQAAAAMAGMVKFSSPSPESPAPSPSADRPLIAATMFGVTTPCVQQARRILEEAGYEVLVFHATGNGGQAMETLIRDGLVAGVLDITTTELADELVGGILSAGPDRLTAAGEMGIPQVVSVGALDMVNFGARDTVPTKFADRKFHIHNSAVTLMRTTPEENTALGEEIVNKLTSARGPATLLLPLRGVSAIDQTAQPFDDPIARKALFDAIRKGASKIDVVQVDAHINDAAFAEAAARLLLKFLRSSSGKHR